MRYRNRSDDIRISFTEFQNNLHKYNELAFNQRVIVSQGADIVFEVIPFEDEEIKYNTEFVQDILQVNEEAEKGYVVKITDANDIWKDIL